MFDIFPLSLIRIAGNYHKWDVFQRNEKYFREMRRISEKRYRVTLLPCYLVTMLPCCRVTPLSLTTPHAPSLWWSRCGLFEEPMRGLWRANVGSLRYSILFKSSFFRWPNWTILCQKIALTQSNLLTKVQSGPQKNNVLTKICYLVVVTPKDGIIEGPLIIVGPPRGRRLLWQYIYIYIYI